MQFNTSFFKELTSIIDTKFGGDADIHFSFVSTKTMQSELKKANKSQLDTIFYSSKCFLIIYTNCNEDVICYINKEHQFSSVYFYTDEVLEKNKILREKNEKHFKIMSLVDGLKMSVPNSTTNPLKY
jgi:hypothetical protein